MLLRDALQVSVEDLTQGLVTPTRVAGTVQILALIAQQPGNTLKLAESSGLPTRYVMELVRCLAAYGAIEDTRGCWQLGKRRAERPKTG
jgi:DNA-binding IclR family transcriptional regulator